VRAILLQCRLAVNEFRSDTEPRAVASGVKVQCAVALLGVDAAARIKAASAALSKLREALPPLASNDLATPLHYVAIRRLKTSSMASLPDG
jgi:hypothetical protein